VHGACQKRDTAYIKTLPRGEARAAAFKCPECRPADAIPVSAPTANDDKEPDDEDVPDQTRRRKRHNVGPQRPAKKGARTSSAAANDTSAPQEQHSEPPTHDKAKGKDKNE